MDPIDEANDIYFHTFIHHLINRKHNVSGNCHWESLIK
jgi:hypothetical protein